MTGYAEVRSHVRTETPRKHSRYSIQLQVRRNSIAARGKQITQQAHAADEAQHAEPGNHIVVPGGPPFLDRSLRPERPGPLSSIMDEAADAHP